MPLSILWPKIFSNIFFIFPTYFKIAGTIGSTANRGTAESSWKQVSPSYASKESVILRLDGGYSEVLDSSVRSKVVVRLPAGRPRIPRVIANREDHIVSCTKPFFADGDTVAFATYVYDCLPEEIGFVFVKTEELGFELQYDDRYEFVPKTLSGAVTFTSDKPGIASVDSLGVIVARKVSDDPVTITATGAGGDAAETLVITKIVPAQVDIVMSVGQSNAYGQGGNAAQAPRVRPGTAYDIMYDGNTQAANSTPRPMPLANTEGSGTAVSGIRQSFANEWYATVGEKVLFINAADPGIKIAEWLPTGKVYRGAKTEYDRVKKLIAANDSFEIYREFFYFNHGSADAGGNFNANYYRDVNTVFDTLFKETDMEFGTIFEYFSSDRDYTTWIRAIHNRIAAENPKIIMGCEMKPYIQADPSLLNSDDLHLTQKGHDLCGKILAQNTMSRILVSSAGNGSPSPERTDAPSYYYDFSNTLDSSCGGKALEVLTSAPKYTSDGTAAVFDGSASLKFPAKVILRSDTDFCVEFRMKLTNGAKQFAVLGSPDNSAQIYVNLSDGKTQGFKVRYGAEGAQGTAITLSVRNTQDLYEYNVWRLYYVSELSLLYLYRDNELQSTEILPGLMTLSQIGKTGTISQSGCTAELDYLKIRTEDAGGAYNFNFENDLREDNAAAVLTESKPGKFEADSVLLKYASNDYSFDQITLDRSRDWSVEVRGRFSKNTAIVASADGSNTIFANTSDPGFRVRTTSASYIKLAVAAGDFGEIHTWRIDYSSSSHTVTLYRDGVKAASGNVNATLNFTHSGTSGTTGGSNSALVDYIHIKQEGINKNGGDTVEFDFNNSLSDNSGNYTFKLLKGSTEYASGDVGYVLGGDGTLSLDQKITLAKKDFELSFRAKFDGNGTIIPNVLSLDGNGFVFAGQTFAVEDKSLLSVPNEWKFTCADGVLRMTYPGGKITDGKTISDDAELSQIGGISMTLYRLGVIGERDESYDAFTVEIRENDGVSIAASSDDYDLSKTVPNVIWFRNGHAVPNGDFSLIGYKAGDVISCRVTYNGMPYSAEAEYIAKSDYPYPLYEDVKDEPVDTEPATDTSAASDTTAEATETGTHTGSGCGSLGGYPLVIVFAALAAFIPTLRKRSDARRK